MFLGAQKNRLIESTHNIKKIRGLISVAAIFAMKSHSAKMESLVPQNPDTI